jgi:ketosteroid isomerase-like protein
MSEHNNTEDRAAWPPAMTRRTALAAVVAAPLLISTAEAENAAANLVQRAAEKNAAFIRGDMQRWSELARIAPDFTLLQPFGGAASHGFDASPERMAQLSNYFRNGKAELELAQTYASDSMIVLVFIERQRGEVGGLPEQDWSLRVTEVYRKSGAEWQLAHRHADPLVHRITLEKAAALARGTA